MNAVGFNVALFGENQFLQIALLASIVSLSTCNALGGAAESWKQVETESVALKVPSQWQTEFKWLRTNGFLLILNSTDFREVDITTTGESGSGRFTQSGIQITVMCHVQTEALNERILRAKTQQEFKSLANVSIDSLSLSNGVCWYGEYSYGTGSYRTHVWCGYYSLTNDTHKLFKFSAVYAAEKMPEKDFSYLTKTMLETIHIKKE